MSCLLLLFLGFVPLTGSAPRLDHGSRPEPDSDRSGVPVLTYHQVSYQPAYYGVTPLRLRADLQGLYDAGFFLILPDDLENGLHRVPLDRRPVMITFDDGWEDNFRYIQDIDGGFRLDPDCAVAIVNSFLDENPDFGFGAVFFVSWDKIPFGSMTEEKLNELLDMGHAIGNHSANHRSFTAMNPALYGREILPALDSFRKRLGLRAFGITAFAYPGGLLPGGLDAREAVGGIQWQGRQAVSQGYVVDGAVGSISRFYRGGDARYRISRIDMALYSVPRLLRWSNLMKPLDQRRTIHDPMPWRP